MDCSTPASSAGGQEQGYGHLTPTGVEFTPPPGRLSSPRSELAWPAEVTPSRLGDRFCIQQLLAAVLHGPSPDEFQFQSDHPRYEDHDRLIVRRYGQVVSHVRLVRRTMRLGAAVIPAVDVADLATLHEHRGHGYATALLELAQRRAANQGALLATTVTTVPGMFARAGWSVCGRHCFSKATPRDILAQLRLIEASQPRNGSPLRRPPKPLSVRLWRQVELGGLRRLYEDGTPNRFGATVRDLEYWHWLIARRAYDRIFVAVEGADRQRLSETDDAIVGYAVMSGGRIVEMMTDRSRPDAAAALLQRACGDAMERQQNTVWLFAPPEHPLHRAVHDARGEFSYRRSDGGAVLMVKPLHPVKLLRRMAGSLHLRARRAHVELPTRLGVRTEQQQYQLSISRRRASVLPNQRGRSYLAARSVDLAQVLLGHLSAAEAIRLGRVMASTRRAEQLAETLFPRRHWWRPPWDDLPC